MGINPLDFGDMFSKSSKDFKKMAQELKDYNKSMRASKSTSNQTQSSRNNSISNPLADARSGFDQFSKQAAAIGKMQKIQTSAITGMAGYALKEQRKRDRRNVGNLEKINRNTEVQRGFGEMISNSFTNFFGLMPNRAARKRAAKADTAQIKEASFSKIRTVSLVNMLEIMKSDKEMAKARMNSDIKHEIKQKSDREKIYKEQRKQGKTASEAWKIAKDGTKESKEERIERTRREDRNNAGLLDALVRPFTMDDKTLQALADDKKESVFAKMFKWLKTGAILAGLGAIIGDFIGDWLGDQADKIFGKDSWLGNIFRDNGWLGGAIAGLAAAVLAPTALIAAISGLGGLLLGPLVSAISGLGGLLLGPAGLVLAAGMAGYFAGSYLYDNLVGPWIDDFYARKQQEEAMFDASEVGQSKITLEGGGEENAYILSEELAAKYKDLTGGGLIAGETVARKIAEKEGMEGGLEGAVESGNSGLRAATFRKESSTGSMISGTETFSAESAKKESKEMRGRSQLHDMSAAGKSGINISITSPETGEETIKHVSQKEGEYAKIKFDLLKVGEMVRAADNLVANVIGKGVYDDVNLGTTEQGLERELEGYRRKVTPRVRGINRELLKLPEGDPLIADVVNAYERLKRHMTPTSWSIMDGSRGEYVDVAGSSKTLGIYGEDNNFYSKGGAGGYLNYKKSPTFPLKGLFSDPLWDALPGPTELASGGLITKPISAIIGEAGPEVVLPLDKAAGVISDALSKAMDSPSMKALASRQRLEAASSASGRQISGGGGVSNTTVVTNQNNSSFVNLTPRATTNNGPSWIRTVSD